MGRVKDTATHHVVASWFKHQPGSYPVVFPEEMLAFFAHVPPFYISYMPQNREMKNTTTHYIGWEGSGYAFEGHLAEYYMIDGQQLTPASFGETDSTFGHWKPIEYDGTYGTNGFYLNFKGGGIIAANGGTITTDGDYKVHAFTSDGTFTPTSVSGDGYVEYLIIAGGGGGGRGAEYNSVNAGGGAGGERSDQACGHRCCRWADICMFPPDIIQYSIELN